MDLWKGFADTIITHFRGRRNWGEETRMTSNSSSWTKQDDWSQLLDRCNLASTRLHNLGQDPTALQSPHPAPLPGKAQSWGAGVPSSATVAAQPDSRNLLARGHLWASGKCLSSSSGTDIQLEHRTARHPLSGWSPQLAWPTLPGPPSLNGRGESREPCLPGFDQVCPATPGMT